MFLSVFILIQGGLNSSRSKPVLFMVVRVVCVEMIELQDNSQICIHNNYGTTEQKEKKDNVSNKPN